MKLLTNLKELSEALYQDPHAVDSAESARELITALNDNLKNAYDFIDKLDDSGYLDGNFYEQEPKTHNARDAFDLYQIGDVINLLDGLRIEALDAEKADY